MPHHILIQPISNENFAEFGDVISCRGHDFFHINDAHTAPPVVAITTDLDVFPCSGITTTFAESGM